MEYKNFYKTIGLLIFCFFILSGCAKVIDTITGVTNQVTGKVMLEQEKLTQRNIASLKCQELCQQGLTENQILKGMCLSETIIEDWSCDIVHSPRQAVDDDPENQCVNFRTGVTQHFVELDGNCSVVRVY